MSDKIKKSDGALTIYQCENDDSIDITTESEQRNASKCEEEKIIAVIENCEDIIEFENNWYAPLPKIIKSND